MRLSKYPSINQYRNVIKDIRESSYYIGKDETGEPIFDRNRKAPTLKFTGTTKIHGTSSAIQYDGKDFICQSRERIITPVDDNAGFASYVYRNKEYYLNLLNSISEKYPIKHDEFIVLYGEWAGKGIQKGVGVSEVEKFFTVFGIKLVSLDKNIPSYWFPDEQVEELITNNPEVDLYNIFTFGKWSLYIDFEQPELVQNTLIQLTEEVEKECPVAKYFGVHNSTGEGIVWSHRDSDSGVVHRFKVKGEKHQISKVKTLAPVDIEKVNSITECVNNILTENRLEQGLEHLRSNNHELDIKNTGIFIKWIISDLAKEEMDTILGSGLEFKEVVSSAQRIAKNWFFEKLQYN